MFSLSDLKRLVGEIDAQIAQSESLLSRAASAAPRTAPLDALAGADPVGADPQGAAIAPPPPPASAGRSVAPPPPPANGKPQKPAAKAVYLGINDASRDTEIKALKNRKDVTTITGAGNDPAMQGKVMAADGKTVLDLGKKEDRRRYMDEIGVSKVRTGADGKPAETPEAAAKRVENLDKVFSEMNPGVRDEMAGFLKATQQSETGEAPMDRVIMSGHSTGNWVYSEASGNPGVTFDQMDKLMDEFPKAADGVEDLMLSACHTLEKSFGTDGGEQYKKIFPKLETAWGYNGFSPSYKQGSAAHVKNFLDSSAGSDPNKVAEAAKKSKQNAKVKRYK